MKKHYASSPDHRFALCASTGLMSRLRRCAAFTLTEVVLAVGVLSLAVVALIGLFGPTMSAVKEVVDRSGALAVSDHINSQLLSGEIYDAFVMGGSASSRFDDLGKMLYEVERNANGTVSTVKAGAGGEAILYAWKEYSATNSFGEADKIELKLSKTPPGTGDLPKVDGTIHVIFLEQGLQQNDGYDFGKLSTSAYFPIYVSIYEVPFSGISSVKAEEYLKGEKGNPLFRYTTAKLR